MPILLIGLLALILCVYGLRLLGRAPPAQVAANMRNGGGVIAALAAVLLLLRGRLLLAAGFGGLSYYIFSGEKFDWRKIVDFYHERQKARKVSQARTALLEMTIDLVSGDVDGAVLDGPSAGHKLSELSRDECLRFYHYCLGRDLDSPRLLETYFDRRFPGWREADESDTDTQGGPRRGAGVGSGEMTEQEAYQTLGLRSGASTQEIIQAHRNLMKERHPDHGGTTDDAARINQAKDRLLRRQG